MNKGSEIVFGINRRIDILIFLYLNQRFKFTQSKLSKSINLSFTSVYSVLIKLEQVGLVITERETKYKSIKLTKKGLEISKRLYDLKEMLK